MGGRRVLCLTVRAMLADGAVHAPPLSEGFLDPVVPRVLSWALNARYFSASVVRIG